MPVIPVAADDLRLADYRHVRDADLLRAGGLFVAEGRLVVRRLLESRRFTTRSLLLTPAAHEDLAGVLPLAPDVPVYLLPLDAFEAVAGFHVHRGCLAIGERGPEPDWRTVANTGGVLVVLEGLADPDNVGSIFRHAAAFGAAGVLLSPSAADPLYRKAIRTSMGAALHVPCARLTPWPETLDSLRAGGVTIAALTLDPSATPLHEAAPRLAAGPLALLLGNEGAGLSAGSLARADLHVRIPMAPGVDSLNVSAAAAIALYETAGRRGRGMLPEPDRPGPLPGVPVG